MLRRILAFFIDHITICLGIGIVSALHINFAQGTSFDTLQSVVFGYSIVMWYSYMIARDVIFNRSIGKKIMGLTIKQGQYEDQTPSKENLIKRNVPLLLLPVEVIMLLIGKNNKRLGDLWTGSIVRNDLKINRTK